MTRILFVYNADSGVMNGLKDWVHKIVSPETYECNLCAITYDNVGMIGRWRDFVDSLPQKIEFIHRDEFVDEFGDQNVTLPAAFVVEDGEPAPWIDADTMNSFDSLDALIEDVSERLQIPN